MSDLTHSVAASVYCNNCDKWFEVDADHVRRGARQVTCEDCHNVIFLSQPRPFWPRMWQRVTGLFGA
jgi:predicted Zn finger-like uncharacterized protein